jgi:FkbM family methyltransferase
LNGRPISIRAGTKDADVVFNTFVHQFHLPPRNLPARQVKVILDLGANIGCTMAHLAGRYPQATVIGVELDSDNASMGRRNIAPWGGRCRLIEGAIWPYDGEVQYDRVVGAEDGFRVCTGSDGQGGRMTTARSISLSTLVREWCPPGQAIDYMKMDIEGAERGVLQTNTGWSDRVRCIKVELHRYSPEECEADLGRLGFRTWHDVEHPACVIGMKSI